MKNLLLISLFFTASTLLFSQEEMNQRCLFNEIRNSSTIAPKEVDDFTITTTDGITRNLYSTLDSGKTVFVDLFYTTCSWCQFYSPIIEQIYLNTGAGEGDIEFWGISNNLYDPDSVIDAYKLAYNISNPCAGPDGGGTTAFSIVVNGQNFYGFPTYCVICPDRTMFFDPCYPPTINGFDPYFVECGATIGIQEEKPGTGKTGIISVYPNPANESLHLEIIPVTGDPVTIEIYTLLGDKVLSFIEGINNDGQTVNIPVGQLPAGLYFVKMNQGDLSYDTRKILISKR